jgi:hypothetical protein
MIRWLVCLINTGKYVRSSLLFSVADKIKNMWPQQAADKIKDVAQHHDFTWTTNFQKLE